jgi:hypothetical protein
MFSIFGGSNAGPPVLLSAVIVPDGGGSPLFTLNWTKSGDMTGYSIYLDAAELPGGIFNTVYGPLDPNLLTFAGDVSTFPGYVPGYNPNDYEFAVFLLGPLSANAANSPIFLFPPY